MPRYRYRALNSEGRYTRGEWVALNVNELEQQLHQLGLELVNAKVVYKSSFLLTGISHLRDLMDFCFYLEQIFESDLPLLDGLREINKAVVSPELKNIIANIMSSVESGKSLSDAVAMHSNFFGNFFSPLLAAGEKTGQMTKIIRYIYGYIQWRVNFMLRIKGMITYPIISFMFISLSFLSIFVVVIPEMRRYFLGLQIDMPWYTRLLINFYDLCYKYWIYWVILFMVSLFALVFSYIELERFRFMINRVMLKIPVVGDFIKIVSMVRFFHIMKLSVSSGVSFLESIELSLPTLSNYYIASQVQGIHCAIQRGESISKAFKRAGIFESIVLQFIIVAERTGELEQVFEQSGRFYDYELRKKIELIETWLQPILLSIVAILLGWIMMSVLGAIYQSLDRLPI